MRYRNFITYTLMLLIAMVSLTLLIGNLFDQKWAGGEGFSTQQKVIVDGFEFKRGQIIDSGDDFREFDFGEAEIWQDKNTQIKLVDGRTGKLEINVIQGRLVVRGPITISTREIKTQIDGTASFVHYSWLDKIEVASLVGKTNLMIEDKSKDISGETIELNTLPPYDEKITSFDAETSSAADFYKWAFGE